VFQRFQQNLRDRFRVRQQIGFDGFANFVGMRGDIILDDALDLAAQILRAAGLRREQE